MVSPCTWNGVVLAECVDHAPTVLRGKCSATDCDVPPGKCSATDCDVPPLPSVNMRWVAPCGPLTPGQQCSAQCKKGFWGPKAFTEPCAGSGAAAGQIPEWRRVNPCKAVECPFPSYLDSHAVWVGTCAKLEGVPYEKKCSAMCRDGYKPTPGKVCVRVVLAGG